MSGGVTGGKSKTKSKSSFDNYSQLHSYGKAQGDVNNILSESRKLYQSDLGEKYFPGQLVAGFTPQQNQALTGFANRAQAGSQLNRDAGQSLQELMGGDNPFAKISETINPYADALHDQLSRRTAENVNHAFGGAGRYGSARHQDRLTQNLSELGTEFYGNVFDRALNARLSAAGGQADSQLAAAQLAPQIANQDYVDLGMLQQAGAARQAQNQQEIDAEKARYEYEQQSPFMKLGQYTNQVLPIATAFGKNRSKGKGSQSTTSYNFSAKANLGGIGGLPTSLNPTG